MCKDIAGQKMKDAGARSASIAELEDGGAIYWGADTSPLTAPMDRYF
jgi:hypothetical protein